MRKTQKTILPMLGLLILMTFNKALALTFVAYGDTRTTASAHDKVVAALAKAKPELVIHTGDLWDGYSAAVWKNSIIKYPETKSLLEANKFLVSRGNHESESDVLKFSPSIVRNNKIVYGYRQGECYFVSLGYGPTTANLAEAGVFMNSTEAKTASWKFLFFHAPLFSSGKHGGSMDNAALEFCKKHQISMVFSGHDHIYERSFRMDGKTVENKSDRLSGPNGTVHMVVGLGGAPFTTPKGGSWTAAKVSETLGYCLIKTTATMLTCELKDINGKQLDKVEWTKGPTHIGENLATTNCQSQARVQLSTDKRSLQLCDLPFAGKVNLQMYSPLGEVLLDRKDVDVNSLVDVESATVTQALGLGIIQNGTWLWLPINK